MVPCSSPRVAEGHSWPVGWQKGSGLGGTHSGGRGHTEMGAVGMAGVRRRGEGGNGLSAPSPMCSMVSLMTSHSMGQRGAGEGPRAEGRAKRARGSPRAPRCRAEGTGVPREAGAGSSAPGAARGPGRAGGAPVCSRALAERGESRVGVGTPPRTTHYPHGREKPPRSTLHARRTKLQAPGQHQARCWGVVGGVSLTAQVLPRTPQAAGVGTARAGGLIGVPQRRGALLPTRLLALGRALLQPKRPGGQGDTGTCPRGQGSPRK